ncbi:hypothetical protein FV218_11875 [Methylobacterium sp. WL69]|uniref:hypothetical protein n=1 Tax=Methylobacterium sp. WL69 TaxID=2603893 RepID=UPI0011CA84C2|nr:hypothetical protein [Methylobacterium sp. WL69]TXM73121.1 hypothetical protein FV218_11875 [Methylobacterium sp. WL69]
MPMNFWKASNKGKTSSEAPAQGTEESGSTPTVILLVDKIVITAKLPHSCWNKTHSAFAELQEANVLKDAHPSAAYAIVKLIALGEETAHISFDPKKSYFPDLRLEFNPVRAGPFGMGALREVLHHLLPIGGWDFLYEKGKISRLDIAVDVQGIRMHHFHLLPQQVLVTKTYEKQAKLKTIYVGKPTGNQLAVYSKSAEMAASGKPLPVPTVRIEKRLKKLGKSLSQLGKLDNPFLGFNIVSTPPGPPAGEETPKNKYIWTLFLDSVARRTLGPALKLLPQAKMTVYRKHFKGYEQPWWDVKKVWAQWPETLKNMRLVPLKDWPD